jgi:glycosyltransferase involved in cell wall biosynthesis
MRIAFVVQRYGLDINGGAELHCRYVAERLAKYADVEILTTCARDYITWKNHYKSGVEEINGLPVRRFPVKKERDPLAFGRIQDELFRYPHTAADELKWIDEVGPFTPDLIQYIKKTQSKYDFFIFFSYRYYHSYHGIHAVPHKSLLVPTAEEDAVIHFQIFREMLNLPQGFLYNSYEERRLLQCLSSNYQVPGVIVGVGSEIPTSTRPESFRNRFNIHSPFLLYVGRIDENKGCNQLFDYFLRYQSETKSELKLVLIGSEVIKVPAHPSILHTGYLEDQEKYDALSACELLVMPSFFESLSMVLLEAWALGKPTLANANCRVLMGQSIRSNAGLFYMDYEDFQRSLKYLGEHPHLRSSLGANGKRFYDNNYRWEIIEKKYMNLLQSVKN